MMRNNIKTKRYIFFIGQDIQGMLPRRTRVVADHAHASLPFSFSQRRAMRANVGSKSGWNAATAVISEFLLVRSLPRHPRFMFRACARTRSSSTRSFMQFVWEAIRTTRSLVHHSWVIRKMDLLTLPSLQAGG